MAKGKNVPANETPEQRFKRMAVMRVNKALRAISLLGNLSGSRYKSTSGQIEKIQTAFRETLTNTFARLQGQKVAKDGFDL